MDSPPCEYTARGWHLEGEERQGGFFTLDVRVAALPSVRLELLQRAALPPGGGPHTLNLDVSASVAGVVRQLAPLLARARVRTLCVPLNAYFQWEDSSFTLEGVLGALPASVACVRVRLRSFESRAGGMVRIREVLSGEAARHPVRLVMLFEPLPSEAEQERLRAMCRAQHPLVRLEIRELQ